jgi:hypothetical protein
VFGVTMSELDTANYKMLLGQLAAMTADRDRLAGEFRVARCRLADQTLWIITVEDRLEWRDETERIIAGRE